MRIIGSFLSPYVRKVLVVLDLKGLRYEIDPIVPFFGDDGFAKLSPLPRVPVLIDDTVALSDSSVILPVPRRPISGARRLPARHRCTGARALARGVRRHAHGRRVHLATVQPSGDQAGGVGREGGQRHRGDDAHRRCHLLAALNACMIVGYSACCALEGIELEDLRIETEGDIDLRSFLGLDPTVKPGYDQLRYTVHLKGNASPGQFEKIHRTVMATSPNYFNLAFAIPMRSRLVVR